MSVKHTCIVRDQLYEAVDAETLGELPDTACNLCAAKPLSELCDKLDACCIGGRHHYWRLVEPESEPEPEIVHTCAGCLYLNICHADPLAPSCPSYEPHPGVCGCCSALLLVAGFAGFIACACFAVFTH